MKITMLNGNPQENGPFGTYLSALQDELEKENGAYEERFAQPYSS